MKRNYTSGILTGLLIAAVMLVGCATVFPWPYYGPSMPDSCYDQGTLLGKTGSDGWKDLPLSECKPDAKVKIKCITQKIDDFYSLKADDMKCHKDLQICQKGNPPQ